jgi:hypothetical protein
MSFLILLFFNCLSVLFAEMKSRQYSPFPDNQLQAAQPHSEANNRSANQEIPRIL